MNYIQLTDADVQHMLQTIGVDRVDELFKDIPASARLDRPLCLPEALSEMELLGELNRLADTNRDAREQICFLGGGIYDHFIPTVVDHLSTRGEFVTAYTPYQAEASQGSLQAFYEYQTMICELTGMDVSNASLYEGATAAAEAVLMARSITGRRRVVVSAGVHPETRGVLDTYVQSLPIEPAVVETFDGATHIEDLRRAVNDDTAAVLIQTPNFFGVIERLDTIIAIAQAAGALTIVSVDPISCALLKRPGDMGADIVVGDAQPLGIPMGLGGPSLGFMACKQKHMRKMPAASSARRRTLPVGERTA
jgi:glycine dehydrogenase subunit 1